VIAFGSPQKDAVDKTPCTGLCVSLKGTLRFITKRTVLARFAGGNPRYRFGLRMGWFFGISTMITFKIIA